MLNERKMLICDCCCRQIVDRVADDKWTIGPVNGTTIVGINKHACRICAPEEAEWVKMMEGR
jgi:hypothetical protein